jgi:hypothetical protein
VKNGCRNLGQGKGWCRFGKWQRGQSPNARIMWKGHRICILWCFWVQNGKDCLVACIARTRRFGRFFGRIARSYKECLEIECEIGDQNPQFLDTHLARTVGTYTFAAESAVMPSPSPAEDASTAHACLSLGIRDPNGWNKVLNVTSSLLIFQLVLVFLGSLLLLRASRGTFWVRCIRKCL